MSIYAMIRGDPQEDLLAHVDEYLEMESDIYDSAKEAKEILHATEPSGKVWYRAVFTEGGKPLRKPEEPIKKENPYLQP